ncbi:MAG: hypothetical protein LBV18_01435 [Alistipes sp.]|jgi:hypothetical protein|nr:hypothetical protein [Alistipes sp.]
MVGKIVAVLAAALVTGAAKAQIMAQEVSEATSRATLAQTEVGAGLNAGASAQEGTASVGGDGGGMYADAQKEGTMYADAQARAMEGMVAPGMKEQTRRERFDRGLAFDTKTPFMPKGLWVAGVNVSYSQQQSADYRLLIIRDMDMEGNTFNISPTVQYMFANNQSIGARFTYSRHLIDIQNMEFSFTDELNSMMFPDGVLHYKYEDQSYMGYITYRYYVGFGASKRLIMFNEVQAGFGGGQQRELSGWNDDKTGYRFGTYQNSFSFRLGLAPGMTFFVTNVFAVEVQMGLLGYEFKRQTQTGTNLELSTRKSSNISSRFDFLSIAFGTTFYL